MVLCVGKKRINCRKCILCLILTIPLLIHPSPERVQGKTVKATKPLHKLSNKPKQSGELLAEEIELPPDIYLVYRCVEAEAGNQDELGKRYVADCIFNRLDGEKYSCLTQVVYEKNQFECVHNNSITITPSEDTIKAVNREYVDRTNTEIKFFRTDYYHSFATPCFKWGAHYFSK